MPPPTLALERPLTLDETVAILAGDVEARVLAGGQSLVPLLTLGFAAPDVIVSLDRCATLDGIAVTPEAVTIGAMVTTRRIELDGTTAALCPLLATAAARVGSPHVRNFGTVVGNLCHADPGSDLIPAALCLGAKIEVRSAHGSRRVTMAELVTGPFATSLAAGDLAVATAAVLLRIEHGAVAEARLVVGGSLRRATRIGRLEEELMGVRAGAATDVVLAADWLEDLADDLLPDTTLPLDYLRAMLPRFVAATARDALGGPDPDSIRGRNPLSSGWICNDRGPPGSVPCDGPAP